MVWKAERRRGTKEWSDSSYNIQKGCEHDCAYCYARDMYERFNRGGHPWSEPVIDMAKVNKRFWRRNGTIMTPTSHDITPFNLQHYTTALTAMLTAGNDVLVVSKPHLECVVALCRDLKAFKDHLEFRFTIGSVDDKVLKFWEPGAPAFNERLSCLMHAHHLGFKTSVSVEPMLDRTPLVVVQEVAPYVTDTIWLGKMNDIARRVKVENWTDEEVKRLDVVLESQTDEAIMNLVAAARATLSIHTIAKVRWKDSIKDVLARAGEKP